MKHKIKVLFLLVINLYVHTAWAWNKPGHMLTGAIAYYTLQKQHPDKLQAILEVLRQHPSMNEAVVGLYPRMGEEGITWQAYLDSLPSEDRDLGLFMLAARWADDARDFKGPDHLPKYYPKEAKRDFWHFIDLPYVAPSQVGKVTPHNPPANNILAAMDSNQLAMGDAQVQAVALGWMFHLVGDIHQPLHCVSLFSSEPHLDDEDGDKGGNELFIKKTATAKKTTNLHSFWDDYMDAGKDVNGFRKVQKRALALLQRTDLEPDQFPQLTSHLIPREWAQESQQLAIDVAYQNGTLKYSLDKTNAEPLTDEYKALAKKVQEQQIVLAGYRLAEWLRKR